MGGESNGKVTPEALIRHAALKTWAADGRASLERIAGAAGFSVDDVEDSFGGEAGLRDAVDEYVVNVAFEYFRDFEPEGSDDNAMDALGRRITALIRDHPDTIRYVARATLEGHAGAAGVFDAFMAIAIQQFEALREEDRLDPGLDIQWASIHIVVFNLAILLFEGVINNHLPEPFLTPEGLERWHCADSELFRHGWLRQPATR